MQVKEIIKQMLKDGMTEEEVKQNLRELGIPNIDELYEQSVNDLKEVRITGIKKPSPPAQEKDEERKELEGLGGGLFGKEKPEGEKEKMTEEATEAEGDIKPLEITSISDLGEEKSLSMQEMIDKPELVTSISKTSVHDIDAVERKLDDTIALLKALQDINKKILETNREVLTRIK